ncbi:phosphate transport system substrate-binding protein [Desulfitispora alkaliphila]|uniref:phosphate ABC transporter substrate-binding protein n=1 Tax=Desulfitispora alkaliphila TaxID=622674 RepID=UPI003D24AF85
MEKARQIFTGKSIFLVATILILGMVALTGCGGSSEEPAPSDDGQNGEPQEQTLSGTITMAGSTSVQPLSEELAAGFMNIHPNTRLEVSGGGSGAGVRAAQEGAADLGASSRAIRDDETGVKDITVAIDGIAVITHPDNPINDIAFDDITKIFNGEITNWSEVGGDDANIVVVTREEGSGTRGAFSEIVLGDGEMAATAIVQNSTGAVRESVSNDANAIGYVSLGALNDSVQAVAVDGVEATVADIVAGNYPVARPFVYLAPEDQPLSELAQAFVDFVLSDDGQAIVEENGFVPVN